MYRSHNTYRYVRTQKIQ